MHPGSWVRPGGGPQAYDSVQGLGCSAWRGKCARSGGGPGFRCIKVRTVLARRSGKGSGVLYCITFGRVLGL